MSFKMVEEVESSKSTEDIKILSLVFNKMNLDSKESTKTIFNEPYNIKYSVDLKNKIVKIKIEFDYKFNINPSEESFNRVKGKMGVEIDNMVKVALNKAEKVLGGYRDTIEISIFKNNDLYLTQSFVREKEKFLE